jgi:hypothetical protein
LLQICAAQALDDDFDLADLPGLDNVADVHTARRNKITISTVLDNGISPDEGRVQTPAGENESAVPFVDDPTGGFGGFGFGDVGMDAGDMGAVGGDAGFAEAIDTPGDVGAFQKHSARRVSRLLTSALGAAGVELLGMEPTALATSVPAPASTHGAAMPTDAFVAAAETPAGAATPAPDGAVRTAAAAAARKRKLATRDASTELSSPAIRAQLENTAPIVVEMVLAPATKRAMRQYERSQLSGLERLRLPPIEGLCPELAAMYTNNIDAAFAVSTAGGDDAAPGVALGELGADLAVGGDVPIDDRFGDDFGAGDQGAVGAYQYGDDEQQEPSTQQLIDFQVDAAAPDGDQGALGADNATTAAYESEGEHATVAGEAEARSWSEHTRRMHQFLELTFNQEHVGYCVLLS